MTGKRSGSKAKSGGEAKSGKLKVKREELKDLDVRKAKGVRGGRKAGGGDGGGFTIACLTAGCPPILP